jgi:hypothetical protein
MSLVRRPGFSRANRDFSAAATRAAFAPFGVAPLSLPGAPHKADGARNTGNSYA